MAEADDEKQQHPPDYTGISLGKKWAAACPMAKLATAVYN